MLWERFFLILRSQTKTQGLSFLAVHVHQSTRNKRSTTFVMSTETKFLHSAYNTKEKRVTCVGSQRLNTIRISEVQFFPSSAGGGADVETCSDRNKTGLLLHTRKKKTHPSKSSLLHTYLRPFTAIYLNLFPFFYQVKGSNQSVPNPSLDRCALHIPPLSTFILGTYPPYPLDVRGG